MLVVCANAGCPTFLVGNRTGIETTDCSILFAIRSVALSVFASHEIYTTLPKLKNIYHSQRRVLMPSLSYFLIVIWVFQMVVNDPIFLALPPSLVDC